MGEPDCETCHALRRGGVGAGPRGVCPPEAEGLEVISPGQGYQDHEQLRRCACGTLYRFRRQQGYDTHTREEQDLWRLDAGAERVLGAVLDADPDERPALLAPALSDESQSLREHAALLLWCLASHGTPIDDALEAACAALELGHEHAYRALLSFLEQGEDEAGLVHGWLLKLKTAERDERFAWSLLKECSVVLGMD